jgi:RNA recognition motif. (a.k.a. RRM, RBD, or RNP domain)
MYSAMPKTVRNDRSFSLDEMLPPAALDAQDPNNATSYGAPYAMNQTVSTSPHYTQSWGYGSAGDVYNSPVPSVQQPPVPTSIPSHYPGNTIPGAMPSQLQSMPNYGGPSMSPFYNSTSPGPPIQTTSSNKGPDGANLFIFHIPNHYTNLDMYRLFYQYGNLLSVRIMVEKDTGRSRGFGFVSYDLPESAALAIKALNGFPVRECIWHSS